MPAPLLSLDEVIARLMSVIRREGYDGASLAELSKATGLGRSSLYHYFPDGKDQMVVAVLDHLEATMTAHVFAPLRSDAPPLERLQGMTAALDKFYGSGREACLLASLGVGDASKQFHPRLRQLFAAWIVAISEPLRVAGIPRDTAQARAEKALMLIEGALLLARAMGEPALFVRTLRDLPAELLRR